MTAQTKQTPPPPPTLDRNPLADLLRDFTDSGQIVDLRLRNGNRIIGPIVSMGHDLIDVAPVVDLESARRKFHDDLTILVEEVVAVGVHESEYRKDWQG